MFTTHLKGRLAVSNKILSLLGFAAKAGRLSYGSSAVLWAIKTHKAKLAVISEEISEKSRKETAYYADKQNIKTIVLKGIDIKTVSDAVGKKCGIISVNDCGFADAILEAYTIKGENADDE